MDVDIVLTPQMQDLRSRLEAGIQVEEAAMERRAGPQYDFNGELLLEVLRRLARQDRALIAGLAAYRRADEIRREIAGNTAKAPST